MYTQGGSRRGVVVEAGGVAGVVGFGSPHGPSGSIQILALSGMALTFTATIMQIPP